MSAENDLRLAWQAAREGRSGRRDALLTLALASASAAPEPPLWVGPVRDWLLASRPDHPFARFSDLDRALDHPKVVASLVQLRQLYPSGRVRWLLARDEALCGPYTGRPLPLTIVLDDLLATPTPHRRRPRVTLGQAVVPVPESPPPATSYLHILLWLGVLCDAALRDGNSSRAA